MKQLNDVLNLTEQLKELLEQRITSKNRDDIIEQTNNLIDLRGYHLQEIHPPFTEEEQEIGQEIIVMNVFIEKRMDRLFTDLKSEMKQVKQKKQSNRSYVNPYKNVHTIDGMFMDKKK